jgi:hypothetical protein
MHENEETPAVPAVCTNCGDAQVGVYCARCGEKQPHHHDLTMGHLAHDVFHELVHLDSKLFRTLRDLVAQPGELTAAYFAGRKQRYIAPLRLFLTLFAVQFVAYTAYKPVAVYSVEGLMAVDSAGTVRQNLEKVAAERKIPPAQLYERIDHRWQKNMSLVSLAGIVGLAVTLKLLFVRRRRFLAEHFVFAAHFMCFSYVVSLLVWPVYALFGIGGSVLNLVIGVLTTIVSLVYLFFGLRRRYGEGGAKAGVKSVLAWAGMFVTSMLLIFGSFIAAVAQVL